MGPASGNDQWTCSPSNVFSFPRAASQSNDTAFDRVGQIHENNAIVDGTGTRSSALRQQPANFSFVDGGVNFGDDVTNADNDFGLSQAFSQSDYLQGFGGSTSDHFYGNLTSDAVGLTAGWATMNYFTEPFMTGFDSQSPHLPTVAERSLDIQQDFIPQIGRNIDDY